MTDDVTVALYFAGLAADADQSVPLVLPVDSKRLEAAGFTLEAFEDDVWGENECAWERETVCWKDVPLDYVSVGEIERGVGSAAFDDDRQVVAKAMRRDCR